MNFGFKFAGNAFRQGQHFKKFNKNTFQAFTNSQKQAFSQFSKTTMESMGAMSTGSLQLTCLGAYQPNTALFGLEEIGASVCNNGLDIS